MPKVMVVVGGRKKRGMESLVPWLVSLVIGPKSMAFRARCTREDGSAATRRDNSVSSLAVIKGKGPLQDPWIDFIRFVSCVMTVT